MRAVVTRVKRASVEIDGRVVGAIGCGLLILLGIGPDDDETDGRRLAEKICRLRIFSDEAGKMNLDIGQIGGKLLVVSQFTLYADLKSRRPGFSHGAKPDLAKKLYESFLADCQELGFPPERGEFGADMAVESINDGPVTIYIDTADSKPRS